MSKKKTASDRQTFWEPTRHQNLFRYVSSGTIFARLKIRGKQVRRSLKTSNLELAKNKLGELERNERAVDGDRKRGKMLFREALEEYLESVRCDATLKPRTRTYYEQRAGTLYKSWPRLGDLDIRRISGKDCEQWAKGFADQYSASSYNHTISIVQHAFKVAVKSGIRHDNPASELKRQGERTKILKLPSSEQFGAFVNEIEHSGSGKSKPCANLVRFLAFSGCRKMEAARVTWADVNFLSSTIRILGDPEQGTKNGESRSIPMVPEMRQLLLRLKEANLSTEPQATVMAVRECQKAMNRAAKVIGMERITHHDLRHLFATRCIESGVDIPTVSRWLGHKDGGALAMKVYGHLRDEHSAAMAQKVYFSKAATIAAGTPQAQSQNVDETNDNPCVTGA
jgi:integrase